MTPHRWLLPHINRKKCNKNVRQIENNITQKANFLTNNDAEPHAYLLTIPRQNKFAPNVSS